MSDFVNIMKMFGDLFEEDAVAFVGDCKGSNGKKSRVKDAEPPPPRGAVTLSGIKNQGGTCYLNSLLQTLLFTPEFREALFSLGPEELGTLSDRDKPETTVRVIPLELQRLFARLLLVDQQAASTSDLTDSFGWSSNEEMSQHDVQELNRILFSALESSLVGTSGSDLINRLYHGTVVNQIVCRECGNTSERQEDFLDLTVAVKGVSGLEEALWSMFVEEELFEGNNLYRCGACSKLVTAAKSAKLRKLPPFLTVSLLRFNFDFARCERYKEMGSYAFPIRIDLRPFCEQVAGAADSDYEYELFSVIIHKGGCYGGHYHVYIKDLDRLGRWQAPEEEIKSKVPVSGVRAPDPILEMGDPLSVLKAILAQEASLSVRVDQLGQKVMETVGVSWNKRFRKSHGPVYKFLQQHPNVFLLDSDGSRVHLKQSRAPSPEQGPQERGGQGDGTPEEPAGSHSTPPHPWFDFNDSSVQPITERDMEKQFQGKESAYMLFYRRAGLQRPEEARGNPRYKVPEHLLEEAEAESRELQRKRAEFDSVSNTVELRLHLGPHYRLQHGALHPASPPQDSLLRLAFDRRKSVGDLRQAVYQLQDSWEGDMALTVAKSLPAGLHLYDTLTDDQQSLHSSGLVDGSDLFVWNGREVCGEPVRVGAESQPVLLSIVCPAGGVGSEALLSETPQGFPADCRLGEVCVELARQTGSELGELLLCRWEEKQSPRWRVYPPADLHKTLSQLTLCDGDALLVLHSQALDCSLFTRSGDMVTVGTPSDCSWLQVEYSSHPQEGSRVATVPAEGDTLLSEIKQKAIEELQLLDLAGSDCCLRPMDRNWKLLPPVREDVSVREGGVKLTSTLFLCPSPPLTNTQLFLYYTMGSDPQAGPEMELVVEESTTVRECLKQMLEVAGLEGECWHLRKVDWCYELGDPLSEEDASLAELQVSSGDTLVLTEGRLPPKGFLKLPVWLFASLRNGVHSETGRDREKETELNNITEQICEHSISTVESSEAALQYVGGVEISGEATLEDLKTQVLTLPGLPDLWVPSPGFLRVWVLESKRPCRILRGNQLHINSLKLGSGTEIAIQPLAKEENLGLQELLLYLQVGVPGERQYYPAEELVWDTSRDSSSRALRQAIASHYSLPPDKTLIAKYCPDKSHWMPISSWSQQVSRKKKKKQQPESLQGAPFHLRDGDLIGVKNLLIDSNRDFSTERDNAEKEKLRREAEDKKKRGQGVRFQSEEAVADKKPPARNRRPEVPLSINVGVFR
ncbi:ubiquitin carboxyl-terminal hydrolase 40 isoform X2 [Acipenser ruthenus]|uniref:ubiquitin carboxyl-terminal hydrolase 40 isoform X2 n=1 Tax=Acipenser ruthenus TaxID=7906 RepID=UPI00145B619B|nr:ubiquitin carboxyl-terminal hydrolase 40 isoform X2 [Acipenser ruthenus]